MAFTFNSLAEAKPVSSTSYLKPYQIHSDVELRSAEIKEGTSSTGTAWKSLNLTFGNEEGIYNHSIFYPNEKNPQDVNRPEYEQSNGGKRYGASRIEELQNQIASIGFAFFPDDMVKFQGMLGKISTVEQLMTVFKKFIDNNLGEVKTNMKLVGRTNDNRVYATLPKFTGIAEAKDAKRAADNGVEVGEWYTWRVSPFNDNPTKLAFSTYEQQQAEAYKKATPTSVGSSKNDTDPINNFDAPAATEDDDLTAMLAGL